MSRILRLAWSSAAFLVSSVIPSALRVLLAMATAAFSAMTAYIWGDPRAAFLDLRDALEEEATRIILAYRRSFRPKSSEPPRRIVAPPEFNPPKPAS